MSGHRALPSILSVALALFIASIATAAPRTGSSMLTDVIGSPAPLAAAPDGPEALTWAYHLVSGSFAPPVIYGDHNVLRLDGSGLPHVVYCDGGTGRLMHAYKTAGGWQPVEVLPHLDSTCRRFGYGIEAGGRQHVAYVSTDGKLQYAVETDYAWSRVTLAGGITPRFVTMELDSDNEPHIVYVDSVAGKLMYRQKIGSTWQPAETISDSGTPGWFSDLTLDGNDAPHLVYVSGDNDALYYARRGSTGWSVPTQIDAYIGTVLGYDQLVNQPGVAVDPNGYPHICYVDGGSSPLPARHVYRDSTGWHFEVLDSAITNGSNLACTIEIDPLGTKHVVYPDYPDLEYQVNDGQGWTYHAIASSSISPLGRFHSLALDGGRRPHISYEEVAEAELWYATPDKGSLPAMTGDVGCTWGSPDCNRCAYDIVTQFRSFRTQPDIMGFHLGSHPDPEWGLGSGYHQHWQGVQRLATAGGRYMVVSQDEVEDEYGAKYSGFAVVEMGSRGLGSSRYRSNRLFPRQYIKDTPPPAEDRIVHTEYIDSDYVHPGSIQVMGDILAIGTDRLVRLYDLSDPKYPNYLGQILDRPDKTGSSSAMAKLATGQYLLIIASSTARPLDFYLSAVPGALDDWRHVDTWDPDAEFADWSRYENLNLVTECGTGDLYLVGTHNNGSCDPFVDKVCNPWGDDYADLYRLDLNDDLDHVVITKRAGVKFDCTHRGQYNCNFDAAGGIYVDAQGQLLLYSTEHENEGPAGDEPAGSIKFAEFRPQPYGTCNTIAGGWVELFEHDTYGGTSLRIDYVDTEQWPYHHDTHYEVYWDYEKNLEGMGDAASSVRWCLPPGWAYRLYVDRPPLGDPNAICRGKYLSLYGAGRPLEVADLDRSPWDMGDIVSCSFFSKDPAVVVGIDPTTGGRLIKPVVVFDDTAMAVQAMSGAAVAAGGEEGMTTIDVPPGAVAQQVTLALTPMMPMTNGWQSLVATQRVFSLTVEAGGVAQPGYRFDLPVDVTLDYLDDEVDGLDETSLILAIWDAGSTVWVDATMTCAPWSALNLDPDHNTLSTQVCQTGLYALMGEEALRPVLFDEAHGSDKTLDWDKAVAMAQASGDGAEPAWFSMIEAQSRLSDEYDLVRHAGGELTDEMLNGYDALILPTTYDAMSAAEVSAVRSFVAQGGGLLVMGAMGYWPPNPELLTSYDMALDWPGLLVPGESADPAVPITHTAVYQPAVDSTELYIHHYGQAVTTSGDAVVLMDTLGSGAFLDSDGDWEPDPGEDGVFATAGAYTTGCGRVVVLGSPTFSDADLTWSENDVLLRDILAWVTEGPPCSPQRLYLPLVVAGK